MGRWGVGGERHLDLLDGVLIVGGGAIGLEVLALHTLVSSSAQCNVPSSWVGVSSESTMS